MIYATHLPTRGLLRLTGKDRAAFLQGLVTNDVEKITPDHTIYAALLSPQGKFQYDLFIGAHHEEWLMDCDGGPNQERIEALLKRLSLYKLRSDVTLENISDAWDVGALWGLKALETLNLPPKPGATKALEGGLIFVDPRLAELGARVILPTAKMADFWKTVEATPTPFEDYDLHRLKLGIPDGGRDVLVDRGILLECGFDELNALDWHKGCYMGQELTARTRYRGLIRKRLVPVHIQGRTPPFETPIIQDGTEVGEMRTAIQDWGLAMLRLEALSKPLPFECGSALLIPQIPNWMCLPPMETGEP